MRIFKEEQRFTQWWVWLIIIAVMLIPLYGIVQQFIFKKPFGDKPMSDSGLIIFSLGMFFFLAFFLSLKLKTRIDEVGIHYQFSPIQVSKKTITWLEIKSANTRKYYAITEYGGWGIKSGFLSRKSKGIAYNVSGDLGIQLVLTSGQKILIGTQKENEVNAVLKTYSSKTKTNEI
jgi:hypothetical protein